MFYNSARAGAGLGLVGRPGPGRERSPLPLHQPPPRLAARPRPLRKCVQSRPRPLALDGQVCGLFAIDIAGFNQAGRDEDIQLYLHRALYDMLESAFDQSGVPWRECVHEDRGDGVLVVVPPTITSAGLVHPLPDKLLALVRRHNRVSCGAARIQLRLAAHLGPVHHDGHGFVGHDVTLLYRMLDAASFRKVLRASGAEIAFITSEYLHENIVVRRPSLAGSVVFQPLTVRAKETRARAWTFTLGGCGTDQRDTRLPYCASCS